MTNSTELNSLEEPWEDEPEETAADDTGREAGGQAVKAKPADLKDARRRLDDLLESQRIKHQIDDDF
ncbi:MAG: hypothetical protein B7Y07_08575 [Halothiobacillus sp. 24-54-40]|jgi:hypothetical protein|nr:hypothetical protein [Halothiobacillaceae bacterium]OYV47123.1 MAG: hypothetical protein B7X12_02315 [Halothiobacillus sp. 20-53-49]OYY40816.1 MAG: hypothetical protein B7Y58_03370 [Halothiobacillus sp. 35-54-62]OYY55812.1 MAG: hypothetical protein B7Y53_03115 [Halothiobacillus sp. 28-55-5]OYZ86296.1 MAG: hypothetical protein B7Y07_08575 [Halothiobacillus sp. 24-54-40]OZA80132.1 MAG: hypothetical protein B7X64_07120 [Halothiobacillus sp. 39-53-45]HQS03408.1 hypothetical protein [Halothioba